MFSRSGLWTKSVCEYIKSKPFQNDDHHILFVEMLRLRKKTKKYFPQMIKMNYKR